MTDAKQPEPRPDVSTDTRPPLPEEQVAGSDDPQGQSAAILEESEERVADRAAAPGSRIEHRTSEDATPPPEG
jgi:hypothetical protein